MLAEIVFWTSQRALAWVYAGYPAAAAPLARSRPVASPTRSTLTDPDRRDRRPRRGRPHRRADRRRVRAGGLGAPIDRGPRRLGRLDRRDRGDRRGHPPPSDPRVRLRRPAASGQTADPGRALRGGPRRRRRPDRRRDALRARLPRRAGRGAARPARRLRDRPARMARRGRDGDVDARRALLALRAARPRAREPGRAADGRDRRAPGRPSGRRTGRCRRPRRWTTSCRSTSARPAASSSTSRARSPPTGRSAACASSSATGPGRRLAASARTSRWSARWRRGDVPVRPLAIWSHKLLRWATPWFIALVAISGLWLAPRRGPARLPRGPARCRALGVAAAGRPT